MVLWPASREDLDFLVGIGRAGDVIERTVRKSIEWRGMGL